MSEYQPAEYQKLDVKQYPTRALRETAEGKFWRRFKAPIVSKQFGPITNIDFCQVYPYNFAVTAATRVVVYNGNTKQVGRNFGRFKDTATSGCFRSDGKLLVAGGLDSIVQVFDANSRAVLRQLRGHKRPVHVTRWSPDRLHVLSGSDDVTVRWWDVSSGKQLARFDGHTDYVRAAAVSPANSETWATGGYDHICKLWDVRAGGAASGSDACMMQVDHGAPIEDCVFLPSGSLLVTAGGSHLCVWDIVGGGRLLHKLTNFQKTVTCVKVSPFAGPASAAAPRLLAGSLDGHVKIIELDGFKVTHASRYPAPVLSLGLSPDCGTLAVGMADGTLVVRQHDRPHAVASGPSAKPQRRERYKPRLTAANFRFFIRGQGERAARADHIVAARRRARLQPYDALLKQFRHREALTAALGTGRADVVSSVVGELSARGALPQALGGRDAAGLLPLLRFLVRHAANPRHAALCAGLTHRVLDAYAPVVGLAPAVDQRLAALRDVVAEELKTCATLMEVQGMLEPLLAASLSGLSL